MLLVVTRICRSTVMSQIERKLEKDNGNYKELKKTQKDLFMKGLRDGYKLAQILKEE